MSVFLSKVGSRKEQINEKMITKMRMFFFNVATSPVDLLFIVVFDYHFSYVLLLCTTDDF